MPYFSWTGVNLQAQSCKGVTFAKNKDLLDAFLLKKDVALLECSLKKILWQRISLQNKVDYFVQLSLLTKAGILLPDALSLLADQTASGAFAAIADDIAERVDCGIPLAQALQKHKKVFDQLVIQMAFVGQESGSLPEALQVLSNHLESMALFKAKLRSALLLPVVTFIFFLTIMAILLAVIVPQFASVFTMMHRDLPTATKSLVMISEWVRSWYLPAVISFVGFLVYLLLCYKKTARGKRAVNQWLLRVPFIKSVIIYNSMAGFFQSIALMLQGGMPLTKAIIIAKEAIENIAIKEQITLVADRINAGDSLAQALATHDQLIGQDLLSLIKVGQETGMLTPIIYRISEVYKQRVFGMLARMNILMQPFLLIILGLMITGLIVALYTPIMSLSYAM